MVVTDSRSTHVACVACVACWLISPSAAYSGDLPDINEVRQLVKEVEQQYASSEAELLMVSFNEQGQQIATAERHLIRAPDRFRSHFFDQSRQAKSATAETQAGISVSTSRGIQAWHGTTYTRIIPKQSVERFHGLAPEVPNLLPYGPILLTLGFDGNLSRFLSEAATIEFVEFRVTNADREFAGNMDNAPDSQPVMIIRDARFPGRQQVISTRLVLDLNDHCRFMGGYRLTIDRDSENVSPNGEIRVAQWLDDAASFKSELVFIGAEASSSEVSRVWVRARGQRGDLPDDLQLFRQEHYSGNPMIKEFDGPKLVSETKYHPTKRPPPPVEKMSPLILWVIINDILLVLILLASLAQIVIWRRSGASPDGEV